MSDSDNLKEIYSQHWQHIRHIENERLGFTSFYLIFLGVGLAYVFKSNGLENSVKYIILTFLLIFSVLGFLFMVRVLLTFWYHYTEIKRITPLLCPGEKLGYEEREEEVENQIVEKENSLWWLNKIYIWLYKKAGRGFPLTLIFPSIFLLGSIGLIIMVLLLVLKVI
jgi:hypothetical protein